LGIVTVTPFLRGAFAALRTLARSLEAYARFPVYQSANTARVSPEKVTVCEYEPFGSLFKLA
jgi:hypothetical protein